MSNWEKFDAIRSVIIGWLLGDYLVRMFHAVLFE